MTRLTFVIVVSIPYIIYLVLITRHVEKHEDRYTELQRYNIVRHMARVIARHGRVKTECYGTENLPKEGGYIMYSNHQGKYDAVGIMCCHDNPLSILIDDKRSHMLVVDQAMRLLKACRMKKDDIRSQVEMIHRITDEVKNGRRYLIFPEGGYDYVENGNRVGEFLPGAFKCAVRAACTIVPVVVIDSYKVFNSKGLKKVKTQVHYLTPIHFDEYKNLNTRELAEVVRDRIVNEINKRVPLAEAV